VGGNLALEAPSLQEGHNARMPADRCQGGRKADRARTAGIRAVGNCGSLRAALGQAGVLTQRLPWPASL